MRRNTLNYIVDVATLLAIFAMIATGLLIRFVLPPGTSGRHGGRELSLWGLNRHEWGDVHFWAAAVLGALLVIHVALHWSWVCIMSLRMAGRTEGQLTPLKRNASGTIFLAAVLALFGGFTWYASIAVRETQAHEAQTRPDRPGTALPRHDRESDHEVGSESIKGSMTLADVERETGVPVSTLIDELNLPQNTTADERLGRLARQHGFTLNQVRTIVEKHSDQSTGTEQSELR